MVSVAQYGFRPGLGTGDAIFDFVNHVYKFLDKDKFISTCFVDGSKAFDSVHHSLLLKKCKAFKIHNKILDWLKSYLGNRRQVTTLNKHKSKECKVGYGVPQGSSLGPLMFLIVYYFPSHVHESKVFMYADDIVLVAAGDSFHESELKLRREVELTNQWCKENCLTINKKKTKVMRITRNRLTCNIPALDVSIGDHRLEDVKEYRYLGVTIDHRFTFKPHVSGSVRSTGHKVHMLARIKKYMEEESSLLVFKTMIVPYFDYASFVIDCTNVDIIKRLQRIQNRGLRVCRYNNMFERCSATDLHIHFDMKLLTHRRYTQLLLIMYKQSKHKGIVVPEHERRTRADHKIKFLHNVNRFTSTDKSPWHRGVQAWDKLTPETQKLKTSAAFKHAVKHLKPDVKY